MQNRQGYCSYCCVRYTNLEQHMSSAQHRYLTTQNRQRMGTSSLMERFLQDVLRHHPYHYQESRSRQNERLLRNTASLSEVVPSDNPVPQEMTDDATGVRGERATKSFEPTEELYAQPSKSQEYIQGVSFRPSVIQKLEKGQQQPLEFVYKIGSDLKEFNQVGIGQATKNGQNLCPSVISIAPASRLPESSCDQLGTTNNTRLPLAAHFDSVIKCDPNKVDRYLEHPDRGSRNPVLSSHLETSSVLYQNPRESSRKSVCINSDKLVIQEDVKSRVKTLSTGFNSHELMGTEGSLKFESLSKLAVNQNKTDMPSNKGLFEDAIPKHHEKFFSHMDHTQEIKHLVFNKPVILEQKSSVNSEMELACGSPQAVSDKREEAVQDLWNEKQLDQEDKNYESRVSEMSFDCNSSLRSLTGQSKVTAKETNLSKEVHADLQHKSNESCASEINSDCDDSRQLASNRTHVIVKGISVQKAVHIRLVDESYDSSDSEMNFDCDTSLLSTNEYPKEPAKGVDPPKGAQIYLVDKSYRSSGSEISAEPVSSPQLVVDQLPMAVTETELQKNIQVGLVDRNYGSGSDTSFDCDVSFQSVVVHSQLAVKERNVKDRHVYLKDNHKSSSAKAHLDCDISPETVTNESQRAVEEINLEDKNDMNINCEYYGSEMNLHTDGQLMAVQPQVAVQEVNTQGVATDLQNKSAKSSVSDISFDSHASLYQSANEQTRGSLDEINLKELNVDVKVRSCGSSSSELTFDSDPPLLSVIKHSELDVEEIRKKHINLENESCGSNSSEITFDSDIPPRSVIDQTHVPVYEAGPAHLEYKSNESCDSEITFDSDVPPRSGTGQPEEAVKERIIQKEDYLHLGRKNDEPSGSEINLNSYVSHSVIISPQVAVNRLNLHKEQTHFESKKNEPTSDYGNFHSVIGHYEELIKEINLQKEEHVHSENRGPSVSEINLKSYNSHLMTDFPHIVVKERNLQEKEHRSLEDKGNVSETRLDSRLPFQSVIQKTEVVQQLWLQKEKQAKSNDECAEFSGSEINLHSDVPHYLVTKPQIAVKEINVQNEEHVILENRSNKSSGSEIIMHSHVLPQSMTENPQIAVLKENHVDPEDESIKSRGFGMNLDINARHSVIDQSHLVFFKEKHVALEETNSESSDCKVSSNSDRFQPLTEQFREVIKKTNLWKVKDIGLKNKVDEPNVSKLIQNSDVSLQSVPGEPEAAGKQTNPENQGHVYSEDNNNQYSGSDMSLDSDFLVQSVVDKSQVAVVAKENIGLEDKHKPNHSCGSEISFDSDDPLQSVADQLRETVKEISLWKDEVDVEDKRDESKGFEIGYDSNVLFQSVTGQTEEVVETNLWKKHVDLEGKIDKPSDSKISFHSDGPLQSVANEIQEATTEINFLRKEHACLDDKGYEPNDSEVIYITNIPLQSAVVQPQILEEEHANLEDRSNDPCPEISFACVDSLQPVADQFQQTDKVMKEDHVYLGDKKYKLGDFEVTYDSDVLIADQSPVAVKQTNWQKKDYNDLENKNCEPIVSEIKCDSGIRIQLEVVDQPQVVCKEINHHRLPAHLGMEEKTSDSEIMSDSDVPLQIVINEVQLSVKEANLQKMLFVNLVTGDSDYEMTSDADVSFQPVIDSPHMAVEGIDCTNAKNFDTEGECYDCFDSELGYVCEVSPRSVSNQSKKTFRVVNQKKDYIIVEESACESYGPEVNFQIDPSNLSTTDQSPESDKKVAKYIDPEDKNCESNSTKRNFKWEDTSQTMTHHQKEVTFCKDQETVGLKDKNYKCSVSAVDCNASPESAILQMADKDNLLKSKYRDPESMSCEPCGSGMNFQCDPSLPPDTDQPQEAINEIDLFKKMPFDLKETNHDFHSRSVPRVGSKRNRKKAKRRVVEDSTSEPVLEALPHVPPSFVGKTWSQIMKEDDMKINALVKEFKEGRFHCYFDDDCETRKVKKKNLNEEKKITSTDLNDTALIQVLLDCDDHIGDFSLALDKPSHHPTEKRPYEQTWRVASRCQAVKVSHGTQTNLLSYLMTKRISGQEDSPTRKRLLLHNDRKPKKIKIGTVEFLESCTNILKPLHPNALFYVLSSNIKLKEGDSFNFSKIHCNDKNDQDFSVQYKYKQGPFHYYDPLSKQIVITPPLNIEVTDSDRNNWIQIYFSDLNSNTGDDDTNEQSCTIVPFMTLSVRHELMSHEGANGSSLFLEKSEILNSSEVLKGSNFQLTVLNGDAAKILPKLFRNKSSEWKKKVHRRKMTTNNNSPEGAYRPIFLQQKTRIASEKQSVWIRTKLNDIIRKYISKYSVFLRHKYQSRSTFIRMNFKKKKLDASALKEAERPAETLLNLVPSADSEEKLRAVTSASPKQLVQESSSKAGNSKKNGNKKLPRKKKKRPKPVKIYELRSLFSQVPYSDRMMTRLLHKLLLSKAH